jgi:hypothetical protein
VSIALGFWIGLDGTVFGIAIVTLLFCVATLVLPAKVTGCYPLPILSILVRPAISAIVATAAFLMLNHMFPIAGAGILINLAVGFVVYAICMLLIDRKQLGEDLNSVWQIMLPRRASPASA